MRAFVLLLLVVASGPLLASDPAPADLKKSLAVAFPGTTIDTVKPSVVPGFYELVIGANVAYATTDGRYLVVGDIYDLKEQVNLSEIVRGELTLKAVEAVGEENMIIFGGKDSKRTITVFTDVDCPYCAKFHLDVPTLVKHGVKVRYLLFPRNGIDSESYKRSVAVWCADDRKKAIGIAKARGKLEMKTCPNPVADLYRLGQRLGISGTPTIVRDDGKVIGGYVPAPSLLAMLGLGTTVVEGPGKEPPKEAVPE